MSLFNWFGKKTASKPPEKPLQKVEYEEVDTQLFFTPNPELDLAIQSIAVQIEDLSAFRAQSRKVAEQFGPVILPDLRARFHRYSDAPPGFTIEEVGLGGWLALWQFAIFEIIYHFRERALPLLRDVAFGKYDWTQANAVEILCRFAAEGIEREQTLNDLKREMPEMRDTALIYIARPLLKQAQSNPELAAIVKELRTIPEFQYAIDEE